MTHCSRLKTYHTFVILKCKWGRGPESKGQGPEVRCQMSECSIGGHSNSLQIFSINVKISSVLKTGDMSDIGGRYVVRFCQSLNSLGRSR